MVVTPQQGKLLGIIGGLSWHSTQEYYRYINEQVTKVWGEQRNPRLMIHSLDFRRVSDLFVKPKLAVEYIVDHCLALERAGCDALLLASNTVHVSSSVIADRVNIPLLHIADAVADDMKARGLHRVLLLGTRYTMTLPFYRERLQDHGLQVVVPELADIEVVNRIIYEELVEGEITESSRQIYLDIIKKYEETADVQGVIAGCTEIPLLIQQTHCSLPLIDSTLVHSQMAVHWFTAAS